jgi:4-carboxymuconolactone decarboxylase
MHDYKEHLRRLAVHDDALLDSIVLESSSFVTSVIDQRTQALLRIAATIALDAAPSSLQHAVTHALAAGATSDEIVATLDAVTPVTGLRELSSAPRGSHSRSAMTSRKRSSCSTSDEPQIHAIGMRLGRRLLPIVPGTNETNPLRDGGRNAWLVAWIDSFFIIWVAIAFWPARVAPARGTAFSATSSSA